MRAYMNKHALADCLVAAAALTLFWTLGFGLTIAVARVLESPDPVQPAAGYQEEWEWKVRRRMEAREDTEAQEGVPNRPGQPGYESPVRWSDLPAPEAAPK